MWYKSRRCIDCTLCQRMELNLFLVLMLYSNLHIMHSTYCKEKNFCILDCGKPAEAKVTWSKVINGKTTDILTNHNGKVTFHSYKFKRYSSKTQLLIISKVKHSDAGRFYCNGNGVDLSVVTGSIPGPCPTSLTDLTTNEHTCGLSGAERVLMFSGVGLAGLVFLLATAAAGRVIAQHAW